MAKLGNVYLQVTSENINDSVEATSYPVEEGVPFSDHIREQPKGVSLDGYVLGRDSKQRLQQLRHSMKKGEILSYTGRSILKNVIILSIDDNRTNEASNGSAVSIKLQFIRIVNTSWEKVPAKQKTQQKKQTNSGKKQPVDKKKTTAVYHKVKKGDTYWGFSRKYGTSIPQLRKWNKYPDRAIPIGVKLRVR
ncbi:LysM peptidoglycan-binding domain-containing protein [Peribacillus asahii]|uniref:LysM peptidoglycan-binding domain-containing protein n=1 Tax=Peribacillus asahii TaxID=228899 RepID=UPI002079E1DB|nr:LysM domain-containing protein [Peribacillus asahii]USK61343.1 LysM peptidoglycan-binding domain-containing protein [Peribacillus asahii]